ncbi:MAG: hypothetical protein HY259_14405 [Chloroflexi bacterium]|nr:hypothetical protein [Chloroflexota bacterium]
MEEAEKILARMRVTKSGFGQKDFQTLYLYFGFHYREGRDRLYFHPRYRELVAQVGRHNKLAKGYAAHAVKLIDRLKELEAEDERKSKGAK